MPPATDPRILVDASTRDDAAVVRLTAERALVATVDFFTPIVDSAYDFGRIAAANALSDVYAMGGTPLFALSIVGWPRDVLPLELLGQVLEGGTALKRDLLSEEQLAPAVEAMTTLNAGAARAMLAAGVHAATDVTGFGLLGHLNTLLVASGVAAELTSAAVPLLPRAREMAAAGAIPGGTRRNAESLQETVRFAAALDPVTRLLLADAQTSGGLLIAVTPERADELVAALTRERTPAAAVIGRVVAGTPGWIEVH